jgi:hypothetical protein
MWTLAAKDQLRIVALFETLNTGPDLAKAGLMEDFDTPFLPVAA